VTSTLSADQISTQIELIGSANFIRQTCQYRAMKTHKGHRFPPDIISYAVWLYYRFNRSHRDIDDVLAEHSVSVSRKANRLWGIKFSARYVRRSKRKRRGYGDTCYIDGVLVRINS
jgi:putative transposase